MKMLISKPLHSLQHGLLALLLLLTSSACQQDAPLGESIQASSTTSAPTVYDVPLSLDLAAALVGDQKPRSLDYVVQEEDKGGFTQGNPYLELEQFQDKAGREVNLIFVCTTDDTQPISIVKTRLYPEITERKERLLRNRPDQQIQLAADTRLDRGSWRIALYYGDLPSSGGSVSVDPNQLEAMKPSSDALSDEGIDLVWAKGQGQLEGIRASAKGSTALAPNQKRRMAIPFLSDWVSLEGKLEQRPGRGLHLKLGEIPLYPQGTLLRIRMHNKGFAPIKLAGFRILTNSLSFRGSYDFSLDKLRQRAKAGQDLSSLYSELNVRGTAYEDSIGRTRAFPNYADFWVKSGTEETLATGASSPNYYLVWAMPRRAAGDATKSRQGIIHLLAYDANRTDNKYNQTRTFEGHRLIPKALIRKPALTRSFGEGFFRLSSGRQSGSFFRLDGVQTPIYNFLDYMGKEENKKYYLESEMKSYKAPTGYHAAKKSDWAGIFPVKLPDNPGWIDKYYFEINHYYHVEVNPSAKIFNSNRYAFDNNENIYEGTGSARRATLFLMLDEQDGFAPNTLSVRSENIAKCGKSNNRQFIHVPAEMKTPSYRKGQIQPTTSSDELLHFSTYSSSRNGWNYICYILTGWGEGQSYLTASALHPGPDYKLYLYSRYLGPAYHRPYAGQWAEKYPWDISFYLWSRENPGDGPKYHPEEDDTQRTLNQEGYTLDGKRDQNKDSDGNSSSATMYWGAEGDWFYHYPQKVRGQFTASGYGKPANAPRTRFYTAADKPRALIRTFSSKPLPRK